MKEDLRRSEGAIRVQGPGKSDLLLWSVAVAISLFAALLYLADPAVQRFELWLPDTRSYVAQFPEFLAEMPAVIRHHLADFAWSLLAAMVVRYCWPLRGRLRQAGLLAAAATSWEWLQLAGAVQGTFDPVDVALGLFAALIVLLAKPVPIRINANAPGGSPCP